MFHAALPYTRLNTLCKAGSLFCVRDPLISRLFRDSSSRSQFVQVSKPGKKNAPFPVDGVSESGTGRSKLARVHKIRETDLGIRREDHFQSLMRLICENRFRTNVPGGRTPAPRRERRRLPARTKRAPFRSELHLALSGDMAPQRCDPDQGKRRPWKGLFENQKRHLQRNRASAPGHGGDPDEAWRFPRPMISFRVLDAPSIK